MDQTDVLLKELRIGLPFEVDWAEYHRKVLHRIARAEAARRRRSVWLLVAGAVSGAAAMLMLMHTFQPIAQPQRTETISCPNAIAPEPDAVASLGYARTVRSGPASTGMIRATIEPAHAPDPRAAVAKPFVVRNGESKIRFDGFSSDDAPTAGFIVAGQTRR